MNFAVVDIETTGLKSDMGFLLCVGIKPLNKVSKIIGLHSVKRESDPLHIDEHLALAAREEMEKYDGWIGWNIKMFDRPFLNDRLALCGHDPLEKRFCLDPMYYARMGQAAMTSSRLDWVARAFEIPLHKTVLDAQTWRRAAAEALAGFSGGRANYKYILAHNRVDLSVTEQVYNRLKNRIQNIHKG